MLRSELCIEEAVSILEQSRHPFLRSLLTWMLEVQGERIVPDLLNLLWHSDRSVRVVSTNALGLIGSEIALPDLKLKFRQQKERGETLQAIGRIGGEEVPSLLLNVIMGEQQRAEWSLSGIAAYHIGRIGDKSAAQQLKNLLTNPKRHIRDAAAQGLLLMGDNAAQPYWRALISRGEVNHLIRAVSLLAECPGVEQAVDLLVEVMVGVDEPRVLDRAFRSLFDVTGLLPYPDVLPSNCSERQLQSCREYAIAALQCQLHKQTVSERTLRLSLALSCLGEHSQPLTVISGLPFACSCLWIYGTSDQDQKTYDVLLTHLASLEQGTQLPAACALARHGDNIGKSFLQYLLHSYLIACQWLLTLGQTGTLDKFVQVGHGNPPLERSIASSLFRLWSIISSPRDMIGVVRTLRHVRDTSLITMWERMIRMARRDLRLEIIKAVEDMANTVPIACSKSLPAIQRTIADPDPRVASVARRILGDVHRQQ